MARRTAPQTQLNLFGAVEPVAAPAAVGAAAVTPEVLELARRLPPGLYLGTSSWTFPGWQGLVYDRAASVSTLARYGLAAYGQHPLFRTVGLDRTFYAPLPAADLRAYADAVPAAFRFLVKAHAWCTQPFLRESHTPGQSGWQANTVFLQPDYAIEHVVQPYLEGLGSKAGPLLWQFSPLDVPAVGGASRFAERLHAFLAALPRGPLYAVELRNTSLFTTAYRDVLADLGVCHCFNVHPSMLPLAEQMRLIAPEAGPALLVRWMLHPSQRYEGARSRYEPFDHLVDHDLQNRQQIAAMYHRVRAAGRCAFVIANNKAEGSSPCTLRHLAEAITQTVQ
ncbi:MAG: DUF72 domain-containing protein [Candidatus Tectimicrobiota bacterium]